MNTRLETPIAEFTTPNPVTAPENCSIEELIDFMQQFEVRHVPIVTEGRAVGIVSDRDLKIVSALNFREKFLIKAADLMTTEPVVFHHSTPLEKVILEMSEKKIGSVLVNDDDGKLLGIFTVIDALNVLVKILRGKK
jgi:acetoin utilization protein AcuB